MIEDTMKETLDLDAPMVKLFRKIHLEAAAHEQKSDLYCPKCSVHLPYSIMTIVQVPAGKDSNLQDTYTLGYFCTLCQEEFDKK